MIAMIIQKTIIKCVNFSAHKKNNKSNNNKNPIFQAFARERDVENYVLHAMNIVNGFGLLSV